MANNRRPLGISTPKDAPVSEQINPFAQESIKDAPVKGAGKDKKPKKLDPQEEAEAARKHSEGE